VTTPACHLRPNKAVDRLSFIEAIGALSHLADLSGYTYYSLGGPYLEDCRLLYEFYPEIKMVSVEKSAEVCKRQTFHLPCGTVELKPGDLKSFITQYDPKDRKSIFWLDYTDLEFGNFEDFMALLGKIPANSMIKITLRAAPGDYREKSEEFRQKFESLMPNPSANPPATGADFAHLVQQMLQIASQQALPSEMSHVFQPVESFYYADGAKMFSLTGLVYPRTERENVERVFRNLQFANLDWHEPKSIDLPILSTKERLHVQRLLPCKKGAGKILREDLGYLIEDDERTTEMKLEQYADFHRRFPYFMKATP
jgi:hypothetical protein